MSGDIPVWVPAAVLASSATALVMLYHDFRIRRDEKKEPLHVIATRVFWASVVSLVAEFAALFTRSGLDQKTSETMHRLVAYHYWIDPTVVVWALSLLFLAATPALREPWRSQELERARRHR